MYLLYNAASLIIAASLITSQNDIVIYKDNWKVINFFKFDYYSKKREREKLHN